MGLYGPCQVDVLGGLRRTQNIKQQELHVQKYQLFLHQDLPRLLSFVAQMHILSEDFLLASPILEKGKVPEVGTSRSE